MKHKPLTAGQVKQSLNMDKAIQFVDVDRHVSFEDEVFTTIITYQHEGTGQVFFVVYLTEIGTHNMFDYHHHERGAFDDRFEYFIFQDEVNMEWFLQNKAYGYIFRNKEE